MMKKRLSAILLLAILFLGCLGFSKKSSALEYSMNLDAKSAILMDAETGEVLYEQNPDEALPPASVTKIMTLLLVMEAIDDGRISLDDRVSVSAEAASMGGSQVYLEQGELMSVNELLKCVVIASANDAAYALAEHVAGSEAAFVRMMNERAAELGMKNTNFENTNGLDDSVNAHLTSARDIAIMSRELISHEKILEYTTTWQDTIRDGSFTLSNTNRLVRFYPGATGLKTGSTSKALFCISATAERNGMHLIAVIMGAPTRDIRNAEAKKLLDYGFANFTVYRCDEASINPIRVTGGNKDSVSLGAIPYTALLKKGEDKRVTAEYILPESIPAPIIAGQCIGRVEYKLDGAVIGTKDIIAAESVDRISFAELLLRLFRSAVGIFGGDT